MGIIGLIILGLIAGAIAKALHRGEEPGGILGTLAVGVMGAVLAGVVANAAGIGSLSGFFSLSTWVIAIGGAFVLLLLYSAAVGKDHGAGDRGPLPTR